MVTYYYDILSVQKNSVQKRQHTIWGSPSPFQPPSEHRQLLYSPQPGVCLLYPQDVVQAHLCCLRPPNIYIVVSLCPRYRDNKQPTFFISMITLAMENATLTGLISTQSGTFLRSICANREANQRRSFVIAFQSESCVWEFVERRSSSFETWSICQSFRRKDWPYYNSPWPKKVEFSRSGTLDGGLAEWKEAVGS